MHPAGPPPPPAPPPPPPPPPQNRSCPSPSLAQCPSPAPSFLQQQHVIYGPITTLQPCPANIHPHCVYTGVQRNPGLTGTLGHLSSRVPIRHTKVTKWQPKSKPARGHYPSHHQQSHQQYCQPVQHHQTHVHQPLTYIPKPLVLYDQCQTNQPPPSVHPPAASFLVASSTFAHAPYGHSDHYTSASGLTLIPQPYYKPAEVAQAFCLLPERSQPTQQHQQPLAGQTQASYYNIAAANACNMQTINPKPSFHLANLTSPYGNLTAFENNQIPSGQTVPTSQIFQNSSMPFVTTSRDKLSIASDVDVQSIICSRNLTAMEDGKHQESIVSKAENVRWPLQPDRETSNVFEAPASATSSQVSSTPAQTNRLGSSTRTQNQDERCSDESAASFDFTIEAEKMVSALCNTVSSNELGKEDNSERNDTSSFGGAAGDNLTNKTNMWFTDFCTEYGVSVGQNNRTTSTQTQEDRHDVQHCPEVMRKTIYWGCNEAETILNSSYYRGNSRAAWLANVSSATRTAVTKSSTCFPIFTGDRTFAQDLINALLRISNGWLVLDNYLNKQYYPSLDEKFDRELTSHFQTWEPVTQNLLRTLVRTLVNLEENIASNDSSSLENLGFQEHPANTSFPGDASLYTSNDIFDSLQRQQEHLSKLNNCDWNDRESTCAFRCTSQSPSNSNFNSFDPRSKSQKETKLRSKWTITENLSSMVDSAKSATDVSPGQSELGFSSGNRFRVRNSSNAATTKIASSRRSLNAEFFHLQNKVMASLGSSNELERQRWGLKEQRYDFVFGASRSPSASAILPGFCEPIFKIRTAGSSYENAYTRRCLPTTNQANTCEPSTSHCTNVNGSVYLVAGPETALDSTYLAGIASADSNESHAQPDRTGNVRIAELNEHNCGSGLVVSSTSISSIKTEPVNAGKSACDRCELATVPRTKMTLLSQIEGSTPSANRDPKEMTASLSAWFASMRNSNGHRTINCPIESRKNENTTVPRTSTHPQESSRSAMDLNRQLHMDANRQLQTLRNMQAIQSQPWNAVNLLNNKRAAANIHRNLDEYDSSEDVRVYMKPGSYNVPKKRHHRKNNRKTDNPANSRVNNTNETPRSHRSRGPPGGIYISREKNDRQPMSVSSLLVASSIQVSTTTTTTSTSIAIPFSSATPIVPPPSKFTPDNSPRILRRLGSRSSQEARQDVAWKAACASAEILLEALNVRASTGARNPESKSPNSMRTGRIDCTSGNRDDRSPDCFSKVMENRKEVRDDVFREASSYEASEDDSSTTCKLSPDRCTRPKSRDIKQPRTNVKTDSWLISTLNNASMGGTMNAEDSDPDSTIGGSMNSSINEEPREYKTVVTSTPEPAKIVDSNDFMDYSTTTPMAKIADCFQEKSIGDSPRDNDNAEQSGSSDRRRMTPGSLSISVIDSSGEFAGRATYSETVRRSAGKSGGTEKTESRGSRQTRSMSSIEPTVRSTIIPIPGRKCQRRDNDRGTSQTIHRSRKITTKRLAKGLEEKESEEGRSSKKIVKEDVPGDTATRPLTVECRTKKKDDGGWTLTKSKVSERGWSVWYSSRRKQALGTMALDKLATIHRTVWQMDEAKLLKCPATSLGGSGASTEKIDDDSRANKNPIFLETIGYKLKNRIYHKIEHFVRDFRKIINNSKLHHKNDTDCVAKIETLSQRLEKLFDDHFSNWDLENVSKSPRNNNGSSNVQTSRCRSPQRQHQKSAASRSSTSAKENSGTATSKSEN